MRTFRPADGGGVSAEIESVEATLLTQLAGQVAGILDMERDKTERDETERGETPARDPALVRLIPDAYVDDPEASAEFRRFTAEDLAGRKVRNALRVITDLADAAGTEGTEGAEGAEGATTVALDAQGVQAWLRALTDIRLVLATRLGFGSDRNELSGEDAALFEDVYDWLGWVQDSLVTAVDS